ncbi:outer membrane protein [Yoonia sp. 2307UL14-13]|uniref:outer membrane protein n=1 Tax=Yoonia sp. 2307UL14-13 TaxID=3126506 RepID=UPI0030B31D94
MKPTNNIVRSTLVALPLAVFGGMATAGGLAEPVAAPVPVAPPPVVPVGTDWTGFYAGGQLGFGSVEAEDDAGDDPITGDETGLLYGVHAGYLYDFGNLVLGGELDYDLSNIEPEVGDDANFEVDSVARAKVLLGYDAGQFLPYVTGGVAQLTTTSDDVDALDTDNDGTFAGIGAKYLLSDSIMLGGEVLQHQFDDYVDGTDVEATTATLRASFRF